MYLPDDDLVELEACKRNISENLLFIIYCEIRWLQRYMVNILHGIWMEDGIQRELQVQVSGALSKPKCLCLSFFRMRCDLCRRCWNSSSRLCRVGGGSYFSEEDLFIFTLQFGTSNGNSMETDWQRWPYHSAASFLWPYTTCHLFLDVHSSRCLRSTTLPELPGRIRASDVTVAPVMPTEYVLLTWQLHLSCL
jgi:hypothetical protein